MPVLNTYVDFSIYQIDNNIEIIRYFRYLDASYPLKLFWIENCIASDSIG